MKRACSLLLTIVIVFSFFTLVPLISSAASTSDLTFELNDDGKSYSVKAQNESIRGNTGDGSMC